jgi:hypothetical protein
MTAILTNQTTSGSSANQTAAGAVTITAGGLFNGGSVVIEISPDGLPWTPVAWFDRPGAQVLDFSSGTIYRATAVIRNGDSISLSAVART